MPKIKNGELILTPKEQNFYKYLRLIQSRTQRQQLFRLGIAARLPPIPAQG